MHLHFLGWSVHTQGKVWIGTQGLSPGAGGTSCLIPKVQKEGAEQLCSGAPYSSSPPNAVEWTLALGKRQIVPEICNLPHLWIHALFLTQKKGSGHGKVSVWLTREEMWAHYLVFPDQTLSPALTSYWNYFPSFWFCFSSQFFCSIHLCCSFSWHVLHST